MNHIYSSPRRKTPHWQYPSGPTNVWPMAPCWPTRATHTQPYHSTQLRLVSCFSHLRKGQQSLTSPSSSLPLPLPPTPQPYPPPPWSCLPPPPTSPRRHPSARPKALSPWGLPSTPTCPQCSPNNPCPSPPWPPACATRPSPAPPPSTPWPSSLKTASSRDQYTPARYNSAPRSQRQVVSKTKSIQNVKCVQGIEMSHWDQIPSNIKVSLHNFRLICGVFMLLFSSARAPSLHSQPPSLLPSPLKLAPPVLFAIVNIFASSYQSKLPKAFLFVSYWETTESDSIASILLVFPLPNGNCQ